jgi:hypothetical protein
VKKEYSHSLKGIEMDFVEKFCKSFYRKNVKLFQECNSEERLCCNVAQMLKRQLM